MGLGGGIVFLIKMTFNASFYMLHHNPYVPTISYKCIGANDKIFVHFIFLNSTPTTPKNVSILLRSLESQALPFNLVPIGSPALFINTQALSSNFTTLPSGLCSFFAVLTTTACLRSPRLTLFADDCAAFPLPESEKFRCFCTTQMIRSPRTYQNCMYDSIFKVRTNLRVPLHPHHGNTFYHCCSRIVYAIQHSLYQSQSSSKAKKRQIQHTFS